MAGQYGEKKKKNKQARGQAAYAFLSKKILLHPNMQRLAKLYSFGGIFLSKKVEFLINATFLLNTLIQKMSHYFKRPI